jgi:hypothetical protein
MQVEHWMPGVRALRTDERAWLSRDLIAGIVRSTIDQGHLYRSVPEAVKAFRREVSGGEGAPAISAGARVSGA